MMKRNHVIRTRGQKDQPVFILSTSFDNGEILRQKKSKNYFQEYVVQNSITDIPFEEYVVHREDTQIKNYPGSKNISPDIPVAPNEKGNDKKVKSKTDEEKLMLLDNIKPEKKNNYTGPAATEKGNVANEFSAFEYDEPPFEISHSASEDDIFARDIEAILHGKKKFNEKSKTVEDRNPTVPSKSPPTQNVSSLDQFTNQHSIFDEIAKSMEYAKAYDLGSISLAQKFDEFDKIVAKENNREPEKSMTEKRPMVQEAKSFQLGQEEILKDMDAITRVSKTKETAVVEDYNLNNGRRKTNTQERNRYVYESQSLVMAQSDANLSYAQNPAILGGIAVADAIQIGLGAAAIVQAQVSATQGSFTLSYDKAQRMLTNDARISMPGSQKTKQSYSRQLFWIGELKEGFADATVIVEWEGNPYGEIGTAIIRRDLQKSTEWTKSSNNTTITKVDRIPLPGTDPRTWPIVFSYEGTFDPVGNGHYEYSGEFEINAFGGLKFVRHEVVDRSFIEWIKIGEPEEYVKRGADIIVPVPDIPKEQIDYLRSKLP